MSLSVINVLTISYDFSKGVVQPRETSSRHTTSLPETESCPTTILKAERYLSLSLSQLDRMFLWMWYRGLGYAPEGALTEKHTEEEYYGGFSRC